MKSILLLFITSGLFAEALEIINNKYVEKVITIEITPKQLAKIKGKYSPYMVMHLTDREMAIIKTKTKLKISPTFLHIYKIDDIKNECTCCMSNVAIYYKGDSIEVPIDYVTSDAEAKLNEPEE